MASGEYSNPRFQKSLTSRLCDIFYLTVKLLHLSDLHFGPPLRRHLVEIVTREAHQSSPDLVVVSGDLTQRARTYQFLQACHFLDRLPSPQLVVPGNHDIPLYNPILRFWRPLSRYRTLIAAATDVAMVGQVKGLSVLGLNSARALILDWGGLSDAQLAWAEAQFVSSPPNDCRIVAVHHHFLRDGGHQRPIRRAKHLLRRFADMGVEVLLVGHRHWARAARTDHGPLIVQAGTVTSRRGKGREKGKNSYNVVEVDGETIQVTCHRYSPDRDRFEPVWTKRFRRTGK